MCRACSCRHRRSGVTRIPNTAAGSGIANSTPDLGIEPIFYTRSSYWPVGRRERKKNFPRRDFPLNRISETKLANELLQQNRALIFPFFYVSLYQNHRHLHRLSKRLRPGLCVVTLGSHKQASLPSILIVRVDGHRAVNVGGNSHLLPCPRWLSSLLLQFSDCSQG